MKFTKILLLITTHLTFGTIGFAAGIYALPIIIAPESPSNAIIASQAASAKFEAHFVKELKDSDALHWGQGVVSIDNNMIGFRGTLAPGPDYKLYLSPTFVETESEFNALKSEMTKVANINTFENFLVPIPPGIEPENYKAVIIWCETFGQFITAAQYR